MATDYDLNFVAETDLAYGVTEDDPADPVIWLPKSQVEPVGKTPRVGEVARFTIPDWLAEDKGLA